MVNESNPQAEALGEVVRKLNFSELNLQNLNTFQYLIEVAPMLPLDKRVDAEPTVFVVCCNDGNVPGTNFLA